MDPAIYLLTSVVVEIVTLHDIVCNVDLPVPSAAPLRTHQVVSIGSRLHIVVAAVIGRNFRNGSQKCLQWMGPWSVIGSSAIETARPVQGMD